MDKAISLAELHVARQGCLVHLKRGKTKEEREALDESSAESGELKPESCPTLLSYLKAGKKLWKWLKSNNLVESFNSLLERRRFGAFHSSLEDSPDSPSHSDVLQPINLFSYYCNDITNPFILIASTEIYPVISSLD